MKRIILTEAQVKQIFESETDFPWYFKPEIKNGCVTLYHGLSTDSLIYALSNGSLIPRTCSEGCYGLWFSIKKKNDYPSGYPCMISIDVPVEEIGKHWQPFEPVNDYHVIAEHEVPLDKYNFKILKLSEHEFDDDRLLTYWKEILQGKYGEERKTSFINNLHDKYCNGSEPLYNYAINLILNH